MGCDSQRCIEVVRKYRRVGGAVISGREGDAVDDAEARRLGTAALRDGIARAERPKQAPESEACEEGCVCEHTRVDWGKWKSVRVSIRFRRGRAWLRATATAERKIGDAYGRCETAGTTDHLKTAYFESPADGIAISMPADAGMSDEALEQALNLLKGCTSEKA